LHNNATPVCANAAILCLQKQWHLHKRHLGYATLYCVCITSAQTALFANMVAFANIVAFAQTAAFAKKVVCWNICFMENYS
jgi:hypothetical protein